MATRFSDYLRGFAQKGATAYRDVGGVRGAADRARQYGANLGEDYKNLHGAPNPRAYMSSDAGRATARYAMGSAFNTFLQRRAQQAGKRGTVGGMVSNALFTFAHTAFQTHMNNLKHDQRIFENVAKARRGSPELEHLSHQELREISDNAKRYGGHDADHIMTTATKELDRRQMRKGQEQAQGQIYKNRAVEGDKTSRSEARHKDFMRRKDELNKQKLAHKQEQHQAKMDRQAELRKTTSHVNAKQATEAVAKQHATGAQGGGKSASDPTIKRRTKKGAIVATKSGGEEYVSNQELNKRKQRVAKTKSSSGRERAHGGGRRGRS